MHALIKEWEITDLECQIYMMGAHVERRNNVWNFRIGGRN